MVMLMMLIRVVMVLVVFSHHEITSKILYCYDSTSIALASDNIRMYAWM